MALPIVAIIGRGNVGKSTLFNRFVGERRAVVDDIPGITRDRLYGKGQIGIRDAIIADTGGLLGGEDDIYSEQVKQQAVAALQQADTLIVMTDGREGLVPADHEIADIVHRSAKPHVLAVNKMERPDLDSYDFYQLGLGEPINISAEQGHGIIDLEERLDEIMPPPEHERSAPDEIAIAVVGKPNAGKSALVNAILGHERVIVSEVPGTTRDAVDTWLNFGDTQIRLVDTAGLRKKGKRSQGTEYYSALRTIRAVQRADIGAIVIDAHEGVTRQDARVALEVHEMGRAAIIVANKWDLVIEDARRLAKEDIDDKAWDRSLRMMVSDFERLIQHHLPFMPYAPIITTCAITAEGVDNLLPLAAEIHEQFTKRITTGALNRAIRRAAAKHSPPTKAGRPLKIYYATQVKTRPPTIVLFVNNPAIMHFSYKRYLINALRREFGFEGTPLRLLIRARGREKPDNQ